MGRYVAYNANPLRNQVGDCVVRTIAKVTGRQWEEIYTGICLEGLYMGDMPTANAVWGAYLRRLGYKRCPVDDKGKDFYTVNDFCADNPRGIYVLAMQSHVVPVIDGRYYDTWDSGNELPVYYWLKQEKEEDKK